MRFSNKLSNCVHISLSVCATCYWDTCVQALDIVKQAKVTQILGGDSRRSSNRGPRLGSRESLESVSQYEAGDEVGNLILLPYYYEYNHKAKHGLCSFLSQLLTIVRHSKTWFFNGVFIVFALDIVCLQL